MTEPALPVTDDTTVTLNCLEGYTNKGGNTATCQNGQVVQNNQPPDCKGEPADKEFNKSYFLHNNCDHGFATF